MVDFFLVLLLAGGGDDLQGIKRGIIEIADMIAVTKADGDNVARARKAAAIYQGALGIITPTSPGWVPPVLTISAQANRGLRRGVGEDPGASRAHDGDRRVPGAARRAGRRLDARSAAASGCSPHWRPTRSWPPAWPSWRTRCAPALRTPALAVAELLSLVGLGDKMPARGRT